jgi:hypothetical protein
MLAQFSFDETMIACQNQGVFPDLVLKVNPAPSVFTGGELIELKESQTYSIASFNSTIPSGKKDIDALSSGIRQKMQLSGDDLSLKTRDVYYLIRGYKQANMKVCLVHGSFFETVKTKTLIQSAFSQVLKDKIQDEKLLEEIVALFDEQNNFSKVRDVENASVKLRFRVMTEAKVEANLLNATKYPDITDNTLNFVTPDENLSDILKNILPTEMTHQIKFFRLKHHLNGYFSVAQMPLVV